MSTDPRISTILDLISRLTPGVTTRNESIGDQDGLDRIIQELSAVVEQRGPKRLDLINTTNSMLDSVIITDLNGRITLINEATCDLLGYPQSDLLGQPVNMLFVEQVVIDAAHEHTIEEKTIVAKDGRRVPVTCAWSHLLNDHGHPEGFIGIVRDITGQKNLEDALRRGEKRFRSLIESQFDMISCYRPDTILTFVNDAYCQFYGKTREELIGQSYLIMVAPEFRDQTRQEAERMSKDPTPVIGEYLNYAADGRACWIQWIIQGLVDETGQVVELQGVGRDITRLKETEAALRESQFFLNKSQTIALIGSYLLDVKTGTWVGSPMLDEIFGIDAQSPKTTDGWIELVHPDQREEMDHYFRDYVMTQHNRFDNVYRIIRHDNQEERWVHGMGELEFDESGNPVRMIGTIQDITERKQIEEIILDSENRFSVIFNESPDFQALSSVEPDRSLRLVAINNRYLDLFKHSYGISQHDVLGRTLLELLRDVHRFDSPVYNGVLKNAHQALDTGQLVRCEEQFEMPWGSLYTESVYVPIFASSNTCRYILYTARDIGERKQAEAKIRQLNEGLEQRVKDRTIELEKANKEIKQFAYIVSHDLRAPLVNLKGFAAELRADLETVREGCAEFLPLVDPTRRKKMIQAVEEDIPEALRFIESSANSMDNFAKAILKLSRLGRLHLELVEVNARSLVNEILHALAYQINQRGITVTIGDLPVVKADYVSMEQILGNILTNAVNYLDPSRPGEIEISAEQEPDETVFHIRDNGRGIDETDMDKVFAPFRRAGKQDTPGEGMGLAYVQTLVHRHGGRIWCQSQSGVGTTFSFTIARHLGEDLPAL